MGVVDDVAPGRLAEDGVQSDQRRVGQAALDGRDHVAEHVAGADARQLIHIADQHQVRARPDGPHQAVGQHQVEHRGLVHNDQIGVERVGLVPGEAQQAVLRLDLQEAVHGLGKLAGGLAQTLSHATGGTGERHLHAAGIGQPDHRAQGDGLARARTAGQNGQRPREGSLHRQIA